MGVHSQLATFMPVLAEFDVGKGLEVFLQEILSLAQHLLHLEELRLLYHLLVLLVALPVLVELVLRKKRLSIRHEALNRVTLGSICLGSSGSNGQFSQHSLFSFQY